MPTLEWIGKRAVLNHHREVPFHLLKEVPELSVGDPDSGNLLIQGDNLLALKALLPYYAGKVKCIYIDPPYNTGMDDRDEQGRRAGWVYDDNVNSAEIREWLNRVVGKESEDLSRHDKWLCMMYPRLAILKDFLRDDGVVFASIDDIEIASLRYLLDEIFGAANRIGTIVWRNATDNNPTNISTEHEYVICYARDKGQLPSTWKSQSLEIKETLLRLGEDFIRRFADVVERQREYTKWFREHRAEMWPFDRYKYIDDEGIYTGSQSVHNPGKEGYRYDVMHPRTGRPCAEPLMGYRFPEETMRELLASGRILFGRDETKIIELKVYAKDYRAKLSSVFELDGRVGTNELKAIFPDQIRPFDFPKPTELIMELLSFATSGEDLVLDSFAGSGTTGHAVLRLNALDGQRRNFVMVERKAEIARGIAAKRIERVALGYEGPNGSVIPALGGGCRFAELGSELLSADGEIRRDVDFCQLASHVYYCETGSTLGTHHETSLLGVTDSKAIYLLYNGVLGDRRPEGGNVLTSAVLESLPPHDGPKVIYGEGCRLGAARLERERITFKQIPYQIKVR